LIGGGVFEVVDLIAKLLAAGIRKLKWNTRERSRITAIPSTVAAAKKINPSTLSLG